MNRSGQGVAMVFLGLTAWLALNVPRVQAQELEDPPFVLVVCAREDAQASGAELAFLQGARLAADIQNRRGGIFGHALELVPFDEASSRQDASAARELLGEACGAIVPWLPDLPAPVRAARARGLPLLGLAQAPALEAQALADALATSLRCARIALLSDESKAARALRKELESRLREPCALVLTASLGDSPKELAQRIATARPDVLVVDAAPEEASAALGGVLASARTPLVLGSRALGRIEPGERELLFVHGLSPAAATRTDEFLAEYRARHGEPGCGAVEGYELVELFAAAVERAGSARPEALRSALASTELDGLRGPVVANAAGEVLVRPALWRLTDRARPYLPPALAAEEPIPDGAARQPDPRLGPPFGDSRTAAFRFHAGTRHVRVHFGDPGVSTIDADLAQLGLSTQGASPFVDHLVREELLARTLSIVSTKYLHAPDGSLIPGQSLKVSFALHGPSKEGTWDAQLAGADPGANGRAFPEAGHCQVFTTNWLSTVLAHALSPPLGPEDLALLDGTYVFGSDYAKDRRSELVRALVQGYASSLGLTCAHEVGHLFGLDHDSGDPTSLMSDDEERGLAPEDARFSAAALERLRKLPGVVQ